MNIGSIVWPVDGRAAINLYLGFLIKVIEALGMSFSSSGPDPLTTAKSYISGALSEYNTEQQLTFGGVILTGMAQQVTFKVKML